MQGTELTLGVVVSVVEPGTDDVYMISGGAVSSRAAPCLRCLARCQIRYPTKIGSLAHIILTSRHNKPFSCRTSPGAELDKKNGFTLHHSLISHHHNWRLAFAR